MMIIVEHYDELLLNVLENFVQQDISSAFWLLREFVRLQVSEYCFAEVRDALLDSVCEISNKHGRVAVCMIELIPDVGLFLLTQEISHQSGLARTGVGRDQRHRQREVRVQTLDQSFAEKQLGRRSGRQQFCA